jgi:hypothetical protein
MYVIQPLTISDSVLLTSNVPETLAPAFVLGTTYTVDTLVGVLTGTLQVIYQSLNNANNGHPPASSPTWWKPVATVYAPYSTTSTYALGDIVTNIGTNVHDLYKSNVAGNLNQPLTDTLKWTRLGVTNRRAMFDGINSTLTSRADAISITLKSTSMVTGFYLGVVEGDEIQVTMTDPVAGLVSDETYNLVQSNSASSFWGWSFNEIVRRTTAFSITLPAYIGATISIEIRKPGGTASCGMCCIGPVRSLGLSQYGLTTEMKDYSTTRFNVDGTSETVERGFAKRMSVDVQLGNDVIDSVQNMLSKIKQTPVVWIGWKESEWTQMYGTFSSFKNVIAFPTKSNMALQIEGKV